MQQFPCPFCGLRDEREFHYVAELGKTRPPKTVKAEEWATYLHTQRNEKGRVKEVWMHLPCAELFLLERDSVSMHVFDATALRKDPA